MGHIAWSTENEIFIAQIDAEHRDLFQLAEAFERAIEAKAPLPETRKSFDTLVTHLEEHFSHEEWLMQSVGYPSIGWHRQQHDTARRRLKLFAPLIQSGNDEAAEAFLEFLAGWLDDHTSVTDRMMAAFVRNYERSHAKGALERWGAPIGRLAPRTTPAEEVGPFPKTIRFCNICGCQTPHEMRPGGLLCRKCTERSVGAELDRD